MFPEFECFPERIRSVSAPYLLRVYRLGLTTDLIRSCYGLTTEQVRTSYGVAAEL
ncbi:hypothetical protein BACCELL_02398 [Bacteroides cellulosilyticus DSM 14838]|uniref:Uncharacterized protein n=1 Tax=Bacteroides cellulosilyticus DSM 14838 TaxID=537012 RepID=E2NDN8_9BACE|nr:hypothetical protein BACCELL_02398 [Bacteroides cellulosilyticus DSM 14838]